jgi:hypothetical protein
MRGRWLGQRLGYTKLLLTVFLFAREALLDELTAEPIDQVQQSVMLAQKNSVCGNLFLKSFCVFNFQPRRKISVK